MAVAGNNSVTAAAQLGIQRVLELMRQISDVSQDITTRKAGHIRIAYLPGSATSHLPKVVANFLEGRPGVRMTIETDRQELILEWMVCEQYDFGITDGFISHLPSKMLLSIFGPFVFFRPGIHLPKTKRSHHKILPVVK